MRDTTGLADFTGAAEGRSAGVGPILDLRLRLGGSPWRMGPAWAVAAGAVAGHAPIMGGENLLRLAAAVLLADAVWGALWLPITPRRGQSLTRARGDRFPYSAARSPIRRILSGLHDGALGGDSGWQGALGGLILAALLSFLLGAFAIVLSVVAIVASAIARFSVGRARRPAFMLALLSVGLPWILGVSMGWVQSSDWPLIRIDSSLALGAAFTVLAWTVISIRSDRSPYQAWPAWLGQVIVLGALAASREPVAVALVGCLMVVPGLWLAGPWTSVQEVGGAIRNSHSWWLVSMLVAAFAVRS